MTDAQRLAQAEATARRWFRVLESLAIKDTSDEVFSVVHTSWMAAEHAVILLRQRQEAPPPTSPDMA